MPPAEGAAAARAIIRANYGAAGLRTPRFLARPSEVNVLFTEFSDEVRRDR
ncbi:hypothetical protein ABZ851_17420 [Streptomyces sp. NPDC047049]|uniref:hypothetical protein n=1 Tax=Streptomyces sp. NPDC047049 TaxID=3156688 RepID=UPI0033CC3F5A